MPSQAAFAYREWNTLLTIQLGGDGSSQLSHALQSIQLDLRDGTFAKESSKQGIPIETWICNYGDSKKLKGCRIEVEKMIAKAESKGAFRVSDDA